ncbi:MAG TPA: hypothetical protein VIR77_04185, partial [Pontiella sp.]
PWMGWILPAVAGVSLAAGEPHIGYVYPAGGQQGETFEVVIGGQHLNEDATAFVSGEGVRVEIINYRVKLEPREHRRLLRRMDQLAEQIEGKEGDERNKLERLRERIRQQVELADVPEHVDPFDMKAVNRVYRGSSKEQFNPQIAGRIRARVIIDSAASTGDRELRIDTPAGLSNPISFQVGSLAETGEVEPNDDHMTPELETVDLPVVMNGQILPGDIDHFRFKAVKGDSLVVNVGARRLIPYLADAVPGWFQAVVALYDEDGNEVAYQDDYKFNPDPVLFFDVPQSGIYTLSIRDSIYRGREDFIYRIAVGELPFITGIFPLGAQMGSTVDIALSGRNLPKSRLSGQLPESGTGLRQISVEKDGFRSNEMPFSIGQMEEVFETEPNDSTDEAQAVGHPLVVNGRIQQPGDVDVFSFYGQKGDSVFIEVNARTLNSPLDSMVVMTGPGMDKPAYNDDYVNKDEAHLHLGSGLVTHHADSYLLCELPESGTYTIRISDTQGQGGHDYAYRLRMGPALPDFALRMEPSGLHIAPGATAVFNVRAIRLNGFNGNITLEAGKLPDGFRMSRAEIPPGSDSARFTITAPQKMASGSISPEISGSAIISGQPVVRPAVPVDDQMQAFLYRHLVPADGLVLSPVSEESPLSFEASVPKSGVIELPLGKETRIPFTGRMAADYGRGMKLELDHPPEGITQEKGWMNRGKPLQADDGGKPGTSAAFGAVVVRADEPLKPGDCFSLVVVAVRKKGKNEVHYPSPAIPVKIVEAQ